MSARKRPAAAAASLIALMFTCAAPAAADTAATATVGWVRLAHLSPDTPPVDVYLYPYGGTTAQLMLKHVAYGTLSPYESLAPGDYLVAMRGAGAGATAKPVISAQVDVAAGHAYTVAGLGASSALALRVLDDKLDPPQGKAGLRVIEASQQSPTASVSVDGDVVATNLRFPDVSGYQPLAPGTRAVQVVAQAAEQSTQLDLAAGSTYTLAVLDGAGGSPRILDLSDATGISVPPKGGVSTGFGGTARGSSALEPNGNGIPAPWWLLPIAAVAAVATAIFRQRRK